MAHSGPLHGPLVLSRAAGPIRNRDPRGRSGRLPASC